MMVIAYRELGEPWDKHGPTDVSLLTKIVGDHLDDTDDMLLDTVLDDPRTLVPIAEWLTVHPLGCRLRAEVVLHAWPPETLPSAPWFEGYTGTRWNAIESAIASYTEIGLALPLDHVDKIAELSYGAGCALGAARQVGRAGS